MFITFDGISGVGKTTVSYIVAERLGLNFNRLDFNMPRRAIDFVQASIGENTSYTYVLSLIQVYGTIVRHRKQGYFAEHFWNQFVKIFYDNNKGGITHLADAVELFHRGLELVGNPPVCPVPDLSIVLDVPDHIIEEREAPHPLPNGLSRGWIAFYQALESVVPYCHIVDGTGTKEEVADRVMRLIK